MVIIRAPPDHFQKNTSEGARNIRPGPAGAERTEEVFGGSPPDTKGSDRGLAEVKQYEQDQTRMISSQRKTLPIAHVNTDGLQEAGNQTPPDYVLLVINFALSFLILRSMRKDLHSHALDEGA